eukprot:465378-Amphidinium_carterae.2
MPDDLQVPHHPKGDNMYTRYECFVGGRGQNKIKCQRCTRKSDMFSHFIFVMGSRYPSGEIRWDAATCSYH